MDINTTFTSTGNLLITSTLDEEDKEEIKGMDSRELEDHVCESFFGDHGLRYVGDDEKRFLGDLTNAPILTSLDYMHEEGDDWNEFSYIFLNYMTNFWFEDLVKLGHVQFTLRKNL